MMNLQGWMDANNSIYVLVDYCDHCEVFKLSLPNFRFVRWDILKINGPFFRRSET